MNAFADADLLALRDMVLGQEERRAREGQVDSVRARASWRALLEGHVVLLDRMASADRNLLVLAPAPPGTPPLTERQRQVVEAAVDGASDKEIAYDLDLRPTTVSSHLQLALRRLGVGTRVELVQLAAALREVE